MSTELTQVLEALTKISGRLDVLEGRIGPALVPLEPDPERADVPEGIRRSPSDSYYYREILTTTGLASIRVCEDCWIPIPRYRDFPGGLISPESDGDREQHGAKTHGLYIEGKPCRGVSPKAVCVSCYQAAFARMYPEAELAPLSEDLLSTNEKYPALPVTAGIATMSRPDGAVIELRDEVPA